MLTQFAERCIRMFFHKFGQTVRVDLDPPGPALRKRLGLPVLAPPLLYTTRPGWTHIQKFGDLPRGHSAVVAPEHPVTQILRIGGSHLALLAGSYASLPQPYSTPTNRATRTSAESR